jgi:hypothetical protein
MEEGRGVGTSGTEAATRYADSNGLSIAYQVQGEAPLDLVLVPGFVSHVELIWKSRRSHASCGGSPPSPG